MERKKIAVILSGCGNKDGAEIHESVMTLWAIHKHGADYQCFAPDIKQHQVLNFISNTEMDEERNVLIEAARIARGNIKNLTEFHAEYFDGLIIPGGFGVVKNLSDYAEKGAECTVNRDLSRAVRTMAALKKPIGALCIAPVVIARILGEIEVTIGNDPLTAKTLKEMGATNRPASHGEIIVDHKRKIVTTPCYMLDARVDQIGEGAENVVKKMLEMMDG